MAARDRVRCKGPGRDATCSWLDVQGPVNPKATSSSTVLSCLGECDGDAALPAEVTMSEFMTWAAAVEYETDRDQGSEETLPFEMTCTSLKVLI